MIEKIKSNQADIRLDHFLKNKLDLSRNKIQELIKNEQILVNNSAVKRSCLLKISDEIQIDIKVSVLKKKNINTVIDYIYEDNHIVVINKQSGLLVHATDKDNEETLVDCLKRDNVSLYLNNQIRPGIVHRLDKMTEGVLIVAKTKKSYTHLVQQFKDRTIKKMYYAMAKGNIINSNITINQPIDRDFKQRNKYKVAKTGKAALTHVTVLERFNSKTLCEIEIESGRTHQIRVHMNFIGHPLLGDTFYSKSMRTQGQLLQAFKLSFVHPIELKNMTIELPISKRILL
jgi:23S rRNA pseudouridine1911/1915/1917 synthase